MNIKFLEVKRAYYADPENAVVQACTDGRTWVSLSTEPVWNIGCQYRIRPRTIRIGNIDVPEPVREALPVGQKYFIASPDFSEYAYTAEWSESSRDNHWFSRGLLHLTKEAAIEHAKALIIVSGGKV